MIPRSNPISIPPTLQKDLALHGDKNTLNSSAVYTTNYFYTATPRVASYDTVGLASQENQQYLSDLGAAQFFDSQAASTFSAKGKYFPMMSSNMVSTDQTF